MRGPITAILILASFLATVSVRATSRTWGGDPAGAATAELWAESGSGAVRAVASADGLRLSGTGWSWSLSCLEGLPASLSLSGSEVELRRGSLDEWFELVDAGVEHRILLPPAADDAPAILEFAVSGSLGLKVREDGQGLLLLTPQGRPVAALREVRAIDAEGRTVDARWERTPGGLRLTVELGGHAGPIEFSENIVPAKGAGSVSAPAGIAETSESLGPLAAPANDQCEGAEVVPASGPFPWTSAAHDITDATMTGDPALPSCQADISRSVWFSFTPATTGNFTFALCSDAPTGTTVPDTVLAVYASTGPCAGLAEVAGGCDDDSCTTGDLQSVVDALTLTAGRTYYVVAWQFGTTAPTPGSSAVQLRVSSSGSGGAPPNDQCGGAEVIPGAGPFPYLTATTADIGGATLAGDPPSPSCQPTVSRSIWYEFTPTQSGNYTFSVCADGPTGTTLDDTVIALYGSSGTCSGLTELRCDDDTCGVEAAQSVIAGVPLTAGTTYDLVVWKYDLGAPSPGNTAVQVRVEKAVGPGNDTCAGAVSLAVDQPLSGSTASTADDYQLSGAACFTGIGQTASTAPGGDVVYRFTAPAARKYSFRVNGYDQTKNAVLYLASDCPAAPGVVASCLSAANRNSGNPAEEVACLSLEAGQTVYAYVDESAATAGSSFALEVTSCVAEVEPNGTPDTGGTATCGVEGSIGTAGEADFFSLGVPEPGSRVFALADGVAAGTTDFDLRVTNPTDTLEYDDANNDVPFGSVSPNTAGTPLGGAAAYLRVSHFSAIQVSEPYRLYAAVQPASSSATPETEPNNTTGTATTGANLYFSGGLSSTTDVDHFQFAASAGEIVTLGLDLDPARDNTPWNGTLALLDSAGAALVSVNDSGATSSTTSGAGSLTAKNPNSPAEGIAYRVRSTGTYYARVAWSAGTAGDYLLSIARGCKVSPSTDLSVSQTDTPDPVSPGASVTYTSTVTNSGTAPGSVVELRDELPAGSSFVAASASQGSCTGTGPVFCHLGTIGAGGSATATVTVTAPTSPGTMTNTVTIATAVIDTVVANDASSQTTTIGSPDGDGDGVPDGQDCAPGDGTAWAIPGEATGLGFFSPGDKTRLSWSVPSSPGGTTVRYDLLRSTVPSDFSTPACVASDIVATEATDASSPPARYFYLVRSENACGGELGSRSNGTPRTGGSCP